MKNAKRIVSVLLLTVLFSAAAQAQEKIVMDSAKTTAKAAPTQEDRLALTPEQQRSFREIIKRYAEQMRDVRKSILSKEEKATKLTEIKLGRDAEVKVLLKEEQYKTYLQLQAERKAKMIDMRKKQ